MVSHVVIIFQDAVRFCLTSVALHRGIVGDEAQSYCEVWGAWGATVDISGNHSTDFWVVVSKIFFMFTLKIGEMIQFD